jgi:hypothetical protein
MDAYSQLRKQAAEKRDRAIQAARDEYAQTLREIARLSTLMDQKPKTTSPIVGKLRRSPDTPFSELTLIEAAERILLESQPMRLTEITLEVQRRGCRPASDPRKVLNSIRTGFAYHRHRFKRDRGGFWYVAE